MKFLTRSTSIDYILKNCFNRHRFTCRDGNMMLCLCSSYICRIFGSPRFIEILVTNSTKYNASHALCFTYTKLGILCISALLSNDETDTFHGNTDDSLVHELFLKEMALFMSSYSSYKHSE